MNWIKIDPNDLPNKPVLCTCLDSFRREHRRRLYGELYYDTYNEFMASTNGMDRLSNCTHYIDVDEIYEPNIF